MMNLRRYSALFISLLLLSFPLYKLVQACSDGPDPYDYYPSFFQPTYLKQAAFTPFHYTSQLKYYDAWYDYMAEEAVPDANIAAWQRYTGNAIPEADLDSFIYRYPYAALSSLYYNIEKGQPLSVSSPMAANAFTKWFQDKKDLEALGYLMYAKQCEPFVAYSDSWDYPERDTAKMSKLMRNGQQLHAAAKSDFIRERYAYQVLRLSLYADKPRQTLALLPKLINDSNSRSEIFARTLAIKAGALFRLKRKAEAAYYYSRAFDMSDNAKRSSFMSFDWAVNDIKPVLALAKTPHEKAVIWLMDGLREYDEGLPQLQNAYNLDPQVRGLDVLMLREINKAEERYQQTELLRQRGVQASTYWYAHYEGEYDYRQKEAEAAMAKTKPYLARLNDFAQKAAMEGKTGLGAFWYLSSAYLYIMSGDMEAAKLKLGVAGTTLLTPRERDLREVLNTLYAIRSAKRMDPATEATILPNLQWLESRAATDKHLAKTYRDLMSTVLSTAYLQSGDTIKAIYILARITPDSAGNYMADPDFTDLPGSLLERLQPEGVARVAAFAAKSGKSEMESWLTKGTSYTAGVLKELEGTKYLRLHQFARAAEAFRQSSKQAMSKYILPDPFLPRVRDMIETDAADSARLYTKLQFAEKMAALQGKEDAASLFEYGLGLYSMSYYGKAHHAFDYYRSTSDVNGYFATPQRKALPQMMQEYYGAVTAEQYFIRAAQKADNADLKAKSLWMAAKCWQKRAPLAKVPDFYEKDADIAYYRYSLSNPYFSQLRAPDLWATPFMQEAQGTCGYLKDYAKRK